MALGALVKSHAANCLIYAYELLKLYYKNNNNNDNTQLQQLTHLSLPLFLTFPTTCKQKKKGKKNEMHKICMSKVRPRSPTTLTCCSQPVPSALPCLCAPPLAAAAPYALGSSSSTSVLGKPQAVKMLQST